MRASRLSSVSPGDLYLAAEVTLADVARQLGQAAQRRGQVVVQAVDQHEGDQHDDEQRPRLQGTDDAKLALGGFLQGAHEDVQLPDELRYLPAIVLQLRWLCIEQRTHAFLPVLQHTGVQSRQLGVAMAVQSRAQRG